MFICVRVSKRETDGQTDRELVGVTALVSSTPATFGSDEAAALRRAITRAFPDAHLVSCTRHLRKNLSAALADKVGLPSKQLQHNIIIHDLFGPNGMSVNAKGSVEFQDHLQFWCENVLNFQVAKLVERITPLMVANVCALGPSGLCLQDSLWTNNNAESLNHVQKHAISWKSQKLVQLVNTLHGVVQARFREAKRAL